MAKTARKRHQASGREAALPQRSERPEALLAQAIIVLAALGGVAYFLWAEHGVAGKWGFSLDDSWIYATFARNLAAGHGYSFNPGETMGGATGPLYVFLLAPLYYFIRDPIWPAKILGILSLCVSCLLLYRTVARLCPGSLAKPLVAGLLLALSPSLLWASVSGMEICVYLLFACLGLDVYTRGRWTLTALWWSLGVWLRPDGLYLVLLGLVARPGLSLKKLVVPTTVAAAIIGGFFAFNLTVGGHIFPNAVAIKTAPRANPTQMLLMVRHWAGLWGLPFGPTRVGEHCVLLLPAIVVGAVGAFRRIPAVAIYALATPVVQALAGIPPGAHGRYIMYVIPFGLVVGIMGFDYVTRRLSRPSAAAWFAVFAVVCVVWQLYTAGKKGIIHGWNVQNINEMQVFLAERIRRGVSPGDTIAVNDVGAMGYFSGCYVVDLVGLVSPKRELPENLRLYKPKLMAIFPDWFERYARLDPKTGFPNFYAADSSYKYAPIVRIALRENTIAARNTMVLFERLRPDEDAAAAAPVYVR